MPVYEGYGVPWNDPETRPQKINMPSGPGHSSSTQAQRRGMGRGAGFRRFSMGRVAFWLFLLVAGVALFQWDMPERKTRASGKKHTTPPLASVTKKAKPTESDLYPYLNELGEAINRQDMKAAIRAWKPAKKIYAQLSDVCMATMREFEYLDSAMWLLTGKYKKFRRLKCRVLDYYHNGGSSLRAHLTIRTGSKKLIYTIGEWTVHYSTKKRKIVPWNYQNLIGKKIVAIYDRPPHYPSDDARILVIQYAG